jgi:hypothetical protein
MPSRACRRASFLVSGSWLTFRLWVTVLPGVRSAGLFAQRLPFRQRNLSSPRGHRTLRLEVIEVVSDSIGETGDSIDSVDLGPFAHECEAALCRQVMGDRAHGLVVAAAAS